MNSGVNNRIAKSMLRHAEQKLDAHNGARDWLMQKDFPRKPSYVRTDWRWKAMVRQAIHRFTNKPEFMGHYDATG